MKLSRILLLLPIFCMFTVAGAFAEGETPTGGTPTTTTLVTKTYVDNGLRYVNGNISTAVDSLNSRIDQVASEQNVYEGGNYINVDAADNSINLALPPEGMYLIEDGDFQEVNVENTWNPNVLN